MTMTLIQSLEYELTLSLVLLHLQLNQCVVVWRKAERITIMISLYVLSHDRKTHKRHILLASRDFARSAWSFFVHKSHTMEQNPL